MQEMGSLKPLVDGECGQQNALVRFTSQVLNSDSQANRGLALSRASTSSLQTGRPAHQQLTDEYLTEVNSRTAAPRSFSMHNLMREIRGVERKKQRGGVPVNWSAEFLATIPSEPALTVDSWTGEFLAQRQQHLHLMNEDLLTGAWETAAAPGMAAQNYQHGAIQWTSEFLSNAEQRLHNITDEARVWEREYSDFQDKLARGEVNLSGYKQEEFWSDLEKEWDRLGVTGASVDGDWTSEYLGSAKLYKDYTFQEENPYTDVEDPLSEGKRLWNEGDLANAILHFEAAVQKMPNSSEAWQYLGLTQAENEQEPSAIAALKRCLEIEPGNLDALFCLSTSYCNESLYSEACLMLSRWLAENPVYSHLVPEDLKVAKKQRVTSFLDGELFSRVEETFLNAAASQPGSLDANLQNSLGVLYNLSGNFDRAVESLEAALQVNPNDARLWNRLGATMANGDRAAEAVFAYGKALELYPAYVRARFNLGISCLNLNSHREAVEHFLSALSLQQRGIGPTAKQNMSDSIWNTMKVATMNLENRAELASMIDRRDFEGLSRAFSSQNARGEGGNRGLGNLQGPVTDRISENPNYLG